MYIKKCEKEKILEINNMHKIINQILCLLKNKKNTYHLNKNTNYKNSNNIKRKDKENSGNYHFFLIINPYSNTRYSINIEKIRAERKEKEKKRGKTFIVKLKQKNDDGTYLKNEATKIFDKNYRKKKNLSDKIGNFYLKRINSISTMSNCIKINYNNSNNVNNRRKKKFNSNRSDKIKFNGFIINTNNKNYAVVNNNTSLSLTKKDNSFKLMTRSSLRKRKRVICLTSFCWGDYSFETSFLFFSFFINEKKSNGKANDHELYFEKSKLDEAFFFIFSTNTNNERNTFNIENKNAENNNNTKIMNVINEKENFIFVTRKGQSFSDSIFGLWLFFFSSIFPLVTTPLICLSSCSTSSTYLPYFFFVFSFSSSFFLRTNLCHSISSCHYLSPCSLSRFLKSRHFYYFLFLTSTPFSFFINVVANRLKVLHKCYSYNASNSDNYDICCISANKRNGYIATKKTIVKKKLKRNKLTEKKKKKVRDHLLLCSNKPTSIFHVINNKNNILKNSENIDSKNSVVEEGTKKEVNNIMLQEKVSAKCKNKEREENDNVEQKENKIEVTAKEEFNSNKCNNKNYYNTVNTFNENLNKNNYFSNNFQQIKEEQKLKEQKLKEQNENINRNKFVYLSEKEGSASKFYKIIKLIHHGNMSQVYMCEENETKKTYAMKVIPKKTSNDMQVERNEFRHLYECILRYSNRKVVQKEKCNGDENDKNKKPINKERKIKAKNIIPIKHLLEDDDYFYIVMKLCTGPTLLEFFMAHLPGTLKLVHIREIFRQILNGLDELESMGIAHQDVKLENIIFKKHISFYKKFNFKNFAPNLYLKDFLTSNSCISKRSEEERKNGSNCCDAKLERNINLKKENENFPSNHCCNDECCSSYLSDSEEEEKNCAFPQLCIVDFDMSKIIDEKKNFNFFASFNNDSNLSFNNENNQVNSTYKEFNSSQSSKTTFSNAAVGTLPYMSPESMLGIRIGYSSDMWSCGVLLFALFDGSFPFDFNSYSLQQFILNFIKCLYNENSTFIDNTHESYKKINNYNYGKNVNKFKDFFELCKHTTKRFLDQNKNLTQKLRRNFFNRNCPAYFTHCRNIDPEVWLGKEIALDMCMRLLDLNPYTRIQNAKEALAHSWLNNNSYTDNICNNYGDNNNDYLLYNNR